MMKKVFCLLMAVMMISLFAATGALAGTAQMIPFVLRANPTTGYDWVITYSQEGIAHLEGDYVIDNSDTEMVGVGGKYEYVMVGDAVGETEVTMCYQQVSDENDSSDLVTYSIRVDEDLNVYVTGVKVGY